MNTQTAILYKPYNLHVEEVKLDSYKDHEVLVKVRAAGLCHSDYHLVTGDVLSSHWPMALGHEGAGIVEAVGRDVTICKSGDHVVFSSISCGICNFCTSGHPILCIKRAPLLEGRQLDGTFRMHTAQDEDVGQMEKISAFSQYTVVPDMSVVKVADHYPFEIAALVSCSVLTGIGAVIRCAKVTPGSNVMVIGCGGIGMNVVQGAALADARMIIAVDVVDFKLRQAKEFGATHTINPNNEDVVQKVMDLTEKAGVDYAFDAESIATPATIGQACACTGTNGTVVVISIPPRTANESIPIEPFIFVVDQKTLKGTFYGDSQPRNDIPNLLAMYDAGKIKLDELITKTYTLEEIDKGYVDLRAGKIIRGMIML